MENLSMAARFINRKSHTRVLPSGRKIAVRECRVLYEEKGKKPRKRYTHQCPQCGAMIVSVHMPNGGWVHYEGRNIKHACLHRGEGLSKKRDPETPDLFD